MERAEALRILGATAGSSEDDLGEAYVEKKLELDRRITAAPTEKLRAKYAAQLAELDVALRALDIGSSKALSAAQIRDLPSLEAPGATPPLVVVASVASAPREPPAVTVPKTWPCSRQHISTDEEYCSVCGAPMRAPAKREAAGSHPARESPKGGRLGSVLRISLGSGIGFALLVAQQFYADKASIRGSHSSTASPLRSAPPAQIPLGHPASEFSISANTPPKGLLLITSVPVGAVVEVDKKVRGVTPLELTDSAGEHLVIVKSDGYFAHRAKVHFVGGERRYHKAELKAR